MRRYYDTAALLCNNASYCFHRMPHPLHQTGATDAGVGGDSSASPLGSSRPNATRSTASPSSTSHCRRPSRLCQAAAHDLSDSVWRGLQQLPGRQRQVLALRYYLDQSEAEIAETLGISRGSVKTHASRGLATLARRLDMEP